MTARKQPAARVAALAAGLILAGVGAHAAPVVFTPNAALSGTPFGISFGPNSTYSFTAATTGNGPGAAIATSGNSTVSSFLGGIADFGEGSTIDQTGQIYTFAAFPAPTLIPNSPAQDFVGLAFTLADGLHYGYAQVAGANLVSYAFESTPNATIVTAANVAPGGGGGGVAVPEPASLTLLLVGAAGLAAARRRVRAG